MLDLAQTLFALAATGAIVLAYGIGKAVGRDEAHRDAARAYITSRRRQDQGGTR